MKSCEPLHYVIESPWLAATRCGARSFGRKKALRFASRLLSVRRILSVGVARYRRHPDGRLADLRDLGQESRVIAARDPSVGKPPSRLTGHSSLTVIF